jgi:tetratricopeptide (TPR) repeat protein
MLVLGFALAVGCKAPVRDGPVSAPLATCRQYSQRGMLAMEQGNWTEAELMLSRAVETCPVDSVAHEHYAETLWRRGAREEALAQIEESIKLRGDDATLEVRAAEMLLALDRRDRAEAHTRWALVLDSQMPRAWLVLGQLRAREGKSADALAYFHRALMHDPNDRGALRALAELQTQLGQSEKALVNWQMLAASYETAERPADVQLALGAAYHDARRYDDAAEAYLAARNRGAPPAEVCRRLAATWQAMGRSDLAEKYLAEAVTLDQQRAADSTLAVRPQTVMPSATGSTPEPTALR